MAVRYHPDLLIFLRDSPLVEKPANLPPAEQWMGQTADATRNSTKPAIDRAKSNDSNLLLDQARRPAAERHMSRNSANPEDIILAPPKNQFSSAARNAGKTFEPSDRSASFRDTDMRDRYNFRPKTGDGEADRTRDSRHNNNLRTKRADGEDSDGWSTVKPRKSFGTEGAERFNGRMGGVDRNREDRRNKDREERDVKERPRGFDTFSRDKESEHDQDRDVRRNGTGRGRNESWFKDKDTGDAPPSGAKDRNSNGDRFVDRSRGWREKERDDNRGERGERNERTDRNDRSDRNERGGDRGDRRWDRDRNERQEQEPAWLDEPAEEKAPSNQIHTADDFQKWKEQQRSKDLGHKAAQIPMDEPKPDEPSFFGIEKPKVETPLEMSNGPDKFFGMWSAAKEGVTPDSSLEPKIDGSKSKATTGKASRFTSFFAPQEDPPRRQTEPAPPPPQAMHSGLAAFFSKPAPATSNSNSNDNSGQSADPAEREAFQSMLQKLQLHASGGSGSTPPVDQTMQPKSPAPEKQRSNPLPQPEPYHQYRTERQEEARPGTRNSQQSIQQDLLNQRQMAGSQPTIRPEQMLQDLVGQRHSAMSQNSGRDQPPARNTNTEFLMGLMQSARAAPEPQRSEQMLLRMQPRNIDPRNVDRQLQQQAMEREQEMQREAAQRERSSSQRQQSHPQPPPGFHMDDPAFQRGPPQYERQPGNPPQPTQILQRPPPPGLDMGWDRQQQQIPPQHRIPQTMAPPPGLASGPQRGMPMPQGIYPPGFPMGAFPPPDVMAGPPRNMQMQPPPGFFPPPPGFMPPGMSGFQGPPEGMAFGAPFDGRPPPQGAYRRQ